MQETGKGHRAGGNVPSTWHQLLQPPGAGRKGMYKSITRARPGEAGMSFPSPGPGILDLDNC